MNPKARLRMLVGLFSSLIFGIGPVGCTLLEVKFPGTPLPANELNIRVLTREFARHSAQVLEAATDTIIAQSADPTIQTHAMQLRLNAIAAVQDTVFQSSPTIALLDTWTLCLQIYNYFKSSAGENLFGEQQAITMAAIEQIKDGIEKLAESVTSNDEYSRYKAFVDQVALEAPLTDLSLARDSIMTQWIQHTGAKDSDLISTVGTAPEVLEDFINRFTFYERTIPKRVRWQTELYMLKTGLDQKIEKQIASLTANSTEVMQGIRNSLSSIERLENRLIRLAESSPELIDSTVDRASDRLLPVADSLNLQWSTTINLLEQMNTQWEVTLAALPRERAAILDAIHSERMDIMDQLNTLSGTVVDKSWTMIRGIVDRLTIFASAGLILMFALPFAMGFIVGRSTAYAEG